MTEKKDSSALKQVSSASSTQGRLKVMPLRIAKPDDPIYRQGFGIYQPINQPSVPTKKEST